MLLDTLHYNKVHNLPTRVHKKCRKDLTNSRRRNILVNSDHNYESSAHLTRSQVPEFDWKENCCFRGDPLENDEKHPDRSSISKTEIPSKTVVQDMCKERNDSWGTEVELRLYDMRDFVATEAGYHRQCRSNFFTFKEKICRENVVAGRPSNNKMQMNFDRLCLWLED